jgi:hypothetical protein
MERGFIPAPGHTANRCTWAIDAACVAATADRVLPAMEGTAPPRRSGKGGPKHNAKSAAPASHNLGGRR